VGRFEWDGKTQLIEACNRDSASLLSDSKWIVAAGRERQRSVLRARRDLHRDRCCTFDYGWEVGWIVNCAPLAPAGRGNDMLSPDGPEPGDTYTC